MSCIFCKIVKKEIPSKIIFEDETVVAFHDISPQAPTHVLVIPKKHVSTLDEVQETDWDILSHMLAVSQKLARQQKIAQSGYRVVINCNAEGGQSVYHVHLHLLGGRQLGGSMVG